MREDIPVADKNRVMAFPCSEGGCLCGKEAWGKGRIVVRPSGTQPLVRIMAERPDEADLRKIVTEIAEAVRAADFSRTGA